MREIVRVYCNLLVDSETEDGDMIPFDDERLAPFHKQMGPDDFRQIGEWLKDRGELMIKEGEALEAYGRAKFGPKLTVVSKDDDHG